MEVTREETIERMVVVGFSEKEGWSEWPFWPPHVSQREGTCWVRVLSTGNVLSLCTALHLWWSIEWSKLTAFLLWDKFFRNNLITIKETNLSCLRLWFLSEHLDLDIQLMVDIGGVLLSTQCLSPLSPRLQVALVGQVMGPLGMWPNQFYSVIQELGVSGANPGLGSWSQCLAPGAVLLLAPSSTLWALLPSGSAPLPLQILFFIA